MESLKAQAVQCRLAKEDIQANVEMVFLMEKANWSMTIMAAFTKANSETESHKVKVDLTSTMETTARASSKDNFYMDQE